MYIPFSPTIRLRYLIGHNKDGHGLPLFDRTDNIRFLTRGRSAFWYVIDKLGLDKKDGILCPAYICHDAVTPFEQAGISIRYYDIEPDMTTGVRPISGLVDNNSRLLILVHYFGYPGRIDGVMDWARKTGLYIVEDCAQSYGAGIDGRYTGTFGDIGLFSLRKFFPIPDGGMLIDNGDNAGTGGRDGLTIYKGLYILRLLLTSIEAGVGTPFVRKLKPGSSKILNDSVVIEDDRAEKGISAISLRVLGNMPPWAWMSRRRRENFEYLSRALAAFGGNSIYRPLISNFVDGWFPKGFPLMIEGGHRDRILDYLISSGVMASPWPDFKDLPQYVQKNIDEFPATRSLVNDMLLLPVHEDIDRRGLDYILKTLSGIQ